MRTGPEILAPAGGPDCLPAAVAGGADAVYLGLRHFNARGRAENFRIADLAGHVAYLHRHGVKCYVVLNTLLHDDEHAKAIELAWHAHQAGVDAAIIQDLGLWQHLAAAVPGLERHASTQMTVHEPGQIAVLASLGARRVILARELSLPDVERCTLAANALGVETEHFVHGALCYSYSGQCLISNFAGCRSANRGTCAQNCRYDYHPPDAPAAQDTPFSMKDQALVAEIAALADMGVASLKIEGRLKGPEYVYTTSRIYRQAVDAWAAGQDIDTAAARRQLATVFARPFTNGWAQGEHGDGNRVRRYQQDPERPADAVLLRCDRKAGRALIRAAEAPQAGWGYACTVGFFNDGFLLIAVDPGPERGTWQCRIRIGERGPRLPEGMPLHRNIDHARKLEVQQAVRTVPADPARDRGGRPLHLRLELRRSQETVLTGGGLRIRGPVPEPARGAGIDAERARQAIGSRLGERWQLAGLELEIEPGLYLPEAVLRRMRQELIQELAATAVRPPAVPDLPESEPPRVVTGLWVAVGDAAAAQAALEAGAERIWYDGQDLWQPAPPELDPCGGRAWIRHPAVAPTSAHLPALGLPVVAGHLGVLAAARAAGLAVHADHHLNCCSVRTLAALGGLGATATTVSLECSAREVARLVARRPASAPDLALTVHGRLPAMITRQEQGPMLRSLQASAADGGRAYQLEVRPGGGSILWEGARLCAAAAVAKTAGLVRGWVLELADLDPAGVARTIAVYRRLCEGGIEPAAVADALAGLAAHGWFPGHLLQGSRALDEVAG